MPALDPDTEATLIQFVEAGWTVERDQQQFFAYAVDQYSGLLLRGAALDGEKYVAEQDLIELERAGYLEYTDRTPGRKGGTFYITPAGVEEARAAKQRVEPIHRVEDSVERYFESEGFRTRHREAFSKWNQAAEYLTDDPVEHASRIGHECREAMRAFASTLATAHGAEEEKGTHATIDAVIESRRAELGKRTTDLLRSLYSLWEAASDLAQRQAHAASRVEPLTPEDGRRCVFYTGLVMHELDRTLRGP